MLLWKEKPLLRSTDAYIAAENTKRFLNNSQKILLVGDAGGREWTYLSRFGKELHVIDIAPQKGIPNLLVQSIENKTPFENETFDAVVMNEVLEHLFFDVVALEEVYRVLKKNGTLVVTVPYMSNRQDGPEHHVRVHSPKTIRRLLEKCGFQIENHFCRGFACRLPQFNNFTRAIIYSFHKIVEILGRKTPDESVDIVNGFLNRIEIFLGTHPLTIRFQKIFSSYGGVMKVRKTEFKKDFSEIQIADFKNI